MKKEDILNKQNFIISVLYYTTIFSIIFFVIKFIFPIIAPFLIGFLIAFFLKPLSKKIAEISNLNKRFCNVFVVLFCYFLIIILIWLIGLKIIAELKAISSSSQEIYKNYILPFYEFLKDKINCCLNSFLKNSDDQTKNYLDAIPINIDNLIASSTKYILSILAKIGASIPEFLVTLAFSVISSIYFSYDYDKITKFITNLLPKKTQHFLFITKGFAIKTAIKYIKSYMFLMLFSFIILATGFFIIRIKNPIGTAAIISVFDSIPFVGSGFILVPWSLILFFSNDFNLAIGLLIVFFIVSCTKNILEPKILGKNLGLHPLTTLISIYIGAKMFGFIGIIAAPITTNIIFLLYRSNKNVNNYKNI